MILAQLSLGVMSLQENVNAIYEYMRVKGPITLEPPYNFSELYQSSIVLAE